MIATDLDTNLTWQQPYNELQGVRISLSSGVGHVGHSRMSVRANNGRGNNYHPRWQGGISTYLRERSHGNAKPTGRKHLLQK